MESLLDTIQKKEKFFKFDANKMLGLLPYRDGKPIEFNVSQQAMLDGLEEKRFWVHIAARRTGKSYAAALLAFLKLLEPNQQVMVVAPNFSLSSIIWEYVTDLIVQFGLECERRNEKEKVIKLKDSRSVFRLLSANNRTSLVGRAAHLLIVDEAAVIEDDEYFNRDLRPVLSTFPDSRCLFITTPRGLKNYIYKYYQRRLDPDLQEDWGGDLFTYKANPYLSEKDIEAARKSSSEQHFAQEYLCKWVTFEGQIYNLNEEKHLLKEDFSIQPQDPRYTFFGGLDIGYRDATAYVVVATDGEHFWVVENYQNKEVATSAHAEAIRDIIEKWGVENNYIDSAAQQSKMDLAYEYDLFFDDAVKDVKAGIEALRNLVDNNKLLFTHQAKLCFEACAAYRWNIKTESPKPVHDEYSHLADALRYAIYSYQKNQVGIFTVPKDY